MEDDLDNCPDWCSRDHDPESGGRCAQDWEGFQGDNGKVLFRAALLSGRRAATVGARAEQPRLIRCSWCALTSKASRRSPSVLVCFVVTRGCSARPPSMWRWEA